MKKLNQGFTLIELVIVITVIAILAAIALPRYIAMQAEARTAKMAAVFGSIRSAAALARARCELDLAGGLNAVGTCGNAAPQVTMDGLAINVINRYPAATYAAGIGAAAGLDVVTPANDGLVVVAGNPILIRGLGATNAATCQISYTAALANAAPVVALVTGGC
ncbi:MAG: prepilin-type N-terminal cleavage/methylation domain-containing protein [Hylemonella sp.]|nr:prepilin-type N-terminal cleavage/methylation domain-containing protein [Hylemonella sp.]